MKFYSEVTKKLYDSEKALMEAETEVKRVEERKLAEEKAKKAKRAERAKEVEDALKTANEAQAQAIALLKSFMKDYGYFHTSFSSDDIDNIKRKDTKNMKDFNNFFDVLSDFLNF